MHLSESLDIKTIHETYLQDIKKVHKIAVQLVQKEPSEASVEKLKN